MSYSTFLEQIFEGKVRIATAEPASESEINSGVEALKSFEKQWRLALAGSPPDFCGEIASWAAVNLYRACQLLMFRDLPAEAVSATLETNYATTNRATAKPIDSSTVHYNVDLVFRFLPDLWKFTSVVAEDDPLSQAIRAWCFAWPLSSVGAKDLHIEPLAEDAVDSAPRSPTAFDISGFVNHPSLMQLYADRILQHQDLTRIKDRAVESQLRYSIGIHEDLSEKIKPALPPV